MTFPTKKVKKRKGIQTVEEVASQCTRGRLGGNERDAIQAAVGAFVRSRAIRTIDSPIGGTVISFLDRYEEKGEGIIKALHDTKVISEDDEETADFPAKQTGDKVAAAPWVGMFEGQTLIHSDIHYTQPLAWKATTLIYVLESEGEIEYKVFGRKNEKIDINNDKFHAVKLEGAGSRLRFPSRNQHYGYGGKRKIISLVLLSKEEKKDTSKKKKEKKNSPAWYLA